MSTRWIDVSIPLRNGGVTWPGDSPYEVTPARRISGGAGCNTSDLALMTHSGTHIDAPWHFEDGGKRLDEIDFSQFFGQALVIEVPEADFIEPRHLGDAPLPGRILFKTRNSSFPVDDPFRKDFVAVSPEAARRLVEQGVRLVGVDGLSVAPWKQDGQVTHHLLLEKDVIVVEGLRLGEIPAGTHWFTVLPLPLAEADGAPCRAFVGVEETP